jgi:hypothetical protein
VFTTYYSASLPTSLFFWLIMAAGAFAMIVVGEQLCVRREMHEGLAVPQTRSTEDADEMEMGSLLDRRDWDVVSFSCHFTLKLLTDLCIVLHIRLNMPVSSRALLFVEFFKALRYVLVIWSVTRSWPSELDMRRFNHTVVLAVGLFLKPGVPTAYELATLPSRPCRLKFQSGNECEHASADALCDGTAGMLEGRIQRVSLNNILEN